MSHRSAIAPSLLAALCLALAPAAARAQAIPPSCRPLIEAERKQIMTPNHAYVTEHSSRRGGDSTTHEIISTGGVAYILMHGRWQRSPMGPRDLLEQLEQNLTTARRYTCQHVGDESVAGVSAAVYDAHNESEYGTADTRSWVARGSGLVLRAEEDLDTGGGDKLHISIRYEYTNVHAPAGVP
jgi:hypothetical protein